MIKETRYISILEVLSRILRHPLLLDVNLEAAILYTIDFIGIFGLPDMYEDKEIEIDIDKHRGELPCDLISITLVKDSCTLIAMRSMTDSFLPKEPCNCHRREYIDNLTFKTQNRIIFTSIPRGKIIVAYKAIPVDEDGYPMLIDNPVYLRTLELYIKKEVFTILFDLDKIKAPVLLNAQQEYCFSAGQLQNEFSIPSISEMESISRSWNTMIPRMTEFDSSFEHLGNREYLKQH